MTKGNHSLWHLRWEDISFLIVHHGNSATGVFLGMLADAHPRNAPAKDSHGACIRLLYLASGNVFVSLLNWDLAMGYTYCKNPMQGIPMVPIFKQGTPMWVPSFADTCSELGCGSQGHCPGGSGPWSPRSGKGLTCGTRALVISVDANEVDQPCQDASQYSWSYFRDDTCLQPKLQREVGIQTNSWP